MCSSSTSTLLDQACQPQTTLRTKSEIQLNIFCRSTHFLLSSILFYKFSSLGKSKNAKYSIYWILQAFSGVTNTCIKTIVFNTRIYQFYARPWIILIKLVLCVVCDWLYRVILPLEAPNKFGKSIPEFAEMHSSVLGCERRPVSASIMSRSCFPSFPICVYKFSSHYLNNIIFIDNSLGPLATESLCMCVCVYIYLVFVSTNGHVSS
jgi:hypothetical protein